MCIYVKNTLKLFEIFESQLIDEIVEQIWCAVQINNEKILIGCIYRPPNSSNIVNEKINQIIYLVGDLLSKAINSSVIIAGVFNYPSIDWSLDKSEYSDVASAIFHNTIDDNLLFQIVQEKTFQLSDETHLSTLDLILTDQDSRIINLFHKPRIGNLSKGHHVRIFKFNIGEEQVSNFDNRPFSYHKGNYEKFNNRMKRLNWENLFINLSSHSCYELSMREFLNCCELFIPKRKKCTKENKKWLTQI